VQNTHSLKTICRFLGRFKASATMRSSLMLRLLLLVLGRLVLPLRALRRTCNAPRRKSMSSYLSPEDHRAEGRRS
jgi:hypothetical protein